MRKVVVLYNPNAGKGKSRLEEIAKAFKEENLEPKFQAINFNTNPFDNNETIDLMVIAGGDGSLNYTLNCIKAKALDIPLAIIPMGTANDFAGAIGMSKTLWRGDSKSLKITHN